MKGKRKMDPKFSAGDIGAGQSVHPLVTGALPSSLDVATPQASPDGDTSIGRYMANRLADSPSA
ncbi:unnamed protein product [Penicillium camemberti]|uniref:Str. FM013 n=1 Tax=Penicillium camemberti (strain FM 013) TaxID=1429867 RepID=A0A0G4PMD0_PENC3|nr:unnamed protein product [Penicillium camemberti]